MTAMPASISAGRSHARSVPARCGPSGSAHPSISCGANRRRSHFSVFTTR